MFFDVRQGNKEPCQVQLKAVLDGRYAMCTHRSFASLNYKVPGYSNYTILSKHPNVNKRNKTSSADYSDPTSTGKHPISSCHGSAFACNVCRMLFAWGLVASGVRLNFRHGNSCFLKTFPKRESGSFRKFSTR